MKLLIALVLLFLLVITFVYASLYEEQVWRNEYDEEVNSKWKD